MGKRKELKMPTVSKTIIKKRAVVAAIQRHWDMRILKSLSTTLLRILPTQYKKARVSTYSSLLKVTDRRKQGFN